MEYPQEKPPYRQVEERVRDYREVETFLPQDRLEIQAARCMDCGIPYCHAFGCPVKNRIPEWNDMVHRKQWRKALALLHSTCNLPEITGRVCPAPCQDGCNRNEVDDFVGINSVEQFIGDTAIANGYGFGGIV